MRERSGAVTHVSGGAGLGVKVWVCSVAFRAAERGPDFFAHS